MLAITHSCALEGVKAYTVRVEARLAPRLPRMVVVGLPDAAVREGRERVRAALRLVAGELLVSRSALVNLSPATRRKASASFDLAIAVALACRALPS